MGADKKKSDYNYLVPVAERPIFEVSFFIEYL